MVQVLVLVTLLVLVEYLEGLRCEVQGVVQLTVVLFEQLIRHRVIVELVR